MYCLTCKKVYPDTDDKCPHCGASPIPERCPECYTRLLDGADKALKIYVPAELYSNYVTDYFWGAYADVIEQR